MNPQSSNTLTTPQNTLRLNENITQINKQDNLVNTNNSQRVIPNNVSEQILNGLNSFPATKVMSFQKSFTNVNGQPQMTSKKIISDGNTGKMYQNIGGEEKVSDLNQEDLKKEFQLPNISLEKIFSSFVPFMNDDLNTSIPNQLLQDMSSKKPSLLNGFNLNNNIQKSKYNWNRILLIVILLLLIYIATKLSMKK